MKGSNNYHPEGPASGLTVAMVVEGGSPMRVPIVRAVDTLGPGLGRFVVVTVRDDRELPALFDPQKAAHYSLGAKTSRHYPRAIWRLARIIHRERVDVVHGVESISGMIGMTAAVLARRGGRLFDRQHSKATPQGAIMSRVAARLADVVRVPSAAAVHWAVTEDKVAAEKVRVIYNFAADPRPVSGEEVAQLRAYLGIGDGELVACSVARLRKEKQLELGIGARQLLEEQLGTPVHYVVVGDGPLRASLEAAAAGHTRVHFAGHQDDVWPWLALSDICWVPSANESFGIVAAEAMATGTPLVASRVGGLAEIITEGRGGRLVEPGSAEALASATAALMATQGGLASAGAHARRRYEEAFTSAAAALSLQRLYAELVKN